MTREYSYMGFGVIDAVVAQKHAVEKDQKS